MKDEEIIKKLKKYKPNSELICRECNEMVTEPDLIIGNIAYVFKGYTKTEIHRSCMADKQREFIEKYVLRN